jgi:inner membrane protein
VQGSTHLAIGVLTGVAVAQRAGVTDPKSVALAAGIAGVAALIPDWIQINFPGLNKTVKGVAGHRGFSHWLLTAWIVSLGVSEIQPQTWGLPVPPGALALWGWLSHIAADALSGHGVPAFWPLPWRLNLGSIKTGGALDRTLGGIAVTVAVLAAILSN